MPAQSKSQQRFFQMVKAVKAGHEIEGVSEETKKRLHKAARDMTPKQVADFAHVATRPKAKR